MTLQCTKWYTESGPLHGVLIWNPEILENDPHLNDEIGYVYDDLVLCGEHLSCLQHPNETRAPYSSVTVQLPHVLRGMQVEPDRLV